MQRMKGQGTPVPNGPKDQNYSSFQNYTNPMTSSMAAPSDPYMSSFYMTSTPYQTFGVGDGTWSNGGEHMQTFLGGYGGQVSYDSHSTIDGIFSGGNFGGFNAPSFNYGFHGNGDYNAWGGSDVRSGNKPYDDYYQRNVYQDERVKEVNQGVQGLNLTDPKALHEIPKESNDRPITSNGAEKISGENINAGTGEVSVGSLNPPKKGLSWANVASQPAKLQPSRRRDKTTLSSIVPGRHMDIGTWEGKNGGPKPVAPPPAPRPAWEAPRGGSRGTTTTSYSTPPPRTSPQATPPQQAPPAPPSPQSPPQQQQMQQQQQPPPPQPPPPSPQQQQHQQPPQPMHHPPVQPPISPQGQQQMSMPPQHHSPPSSMLQSPPIRNEASLSPQGPPPSYAASIPPPQESPVDDGPTMEEIQIRNQYNPKEFELSPKNARFFVIKSYSEDDIHRSIKYEIWCSTEHGNKRLDTAFREREGKGPIFLFFSVNGSGHFCGIAQMISQVDYNSTSNVWAQDKWKGQFPVKWIYVKDVPNNPLRHIRLENNENKPVTNSRDTQEVPYDKGKQVLKIIHTYRHTSSIFDDFIHYEKRQEESEYRKGHQQTSYKEVEPRDDRDRRHHEGQGQGQGQQQQQGHHPPHRGEHHHHSRGDRGGGGGGGDFRGGEHPRDFHRDYHPRGRGRGGHHRGGPPRQ